MANENKQVGGFLNYEGVDVTGELLGIVYGILNWVIMILSMAVNFAIALLNMVLGMIG